MNRLLMGLLRLIRFVLDLVSDLAFGFWYSGAHTPVPPVSDVLLLDSASALAEKIRTGKVTSRQVLEVYRKRVGEVNPTLNCLVDTRFEEALEEARAADELVKETADPDKLARERPFLGVPFTTKDCFAVKGLSWTTGLKCREGVKATTNAPAVQRMLDAGAIVVGVTNVPELCMWWETYNTVYGRTNNPYHTARMVGGSSGGEACAVASAASVFGIGSDVGGSIRMPSFFCGIFGHKPSAGGVVPNEGQLPAAVGKINTDYLTTGPMCRYARDLMPMFKVLVGSKNALKLRLDEPVDVRKIKVFYMEDNGGHPVTSPVHQDLKDAQLKLVHQLKQAYGIKCKKVQLRDFFHSYEMFAQGMSSEPDAPTFAAEMVEGRGEVNYWQELAKWAWPTTSSAHTFPALFLSKEEKQFGPHHPRHQRMLQKIEDLKNEMELMLGDDGVLLYPSNSTPALYHGQALLRFANFSYTGVINMLGLPSTQCPLGVGSWGVPLGVQVVAGRDRDRVSLAVAAEIEKLAGGWVPPSGVK